MSTPAIPITPTKSSQIHGYGYDAATQTLAIQFHDRAGKAPGGPKPGTVYHYANVKPEDFDAFDKAESKYGHFHKTIKANPKAHPFTKVQ